MLIASNGLSVPAVPMTINYGHYLTPVGAFKKQDFLDDVDVLVELLISGSMLRYGKFKPQVLVRGGLVLDVTEPITSATKFLEGTTGHTKVNFDTFEFLAPAMKTKRNIKIKRLFGVWFETIAAAYFGSVLHCRIMEVAYDKKPNNQSIMVNLLKARQQRNDIALTMGTPVTITRVYDCSATNLRVSTPGFVWNNVAAVVEFPFSIITGQIADSLKTGIPPEATMSDEVAVQIAEASVAHRFGVDLTEISFRELTPLEHELLEGSMDFFMANPMILLDIVGTPSNELTVSALFDVIIRAANQYLSTNQEILVDVELSPRSVGEWMFKINGVPDFRYYEGIDAIYRRKELPNTSELSSMVASALNRMHPTLIAGVEIVGDRTILVEGKTLEYPDYLDSGYRLLPGEENTNAAVHLTYFQSVIQAAHSLLVGNGTVSPFVLKTIGLPGIVNGAAFAIE